MIPNEHIAVSTEGFDSHPDDEVELLDELFYQIARADLEYADTFRATLVGEGFEKHKTKQSCCGVWESTYKCKSGRRYFIGCNHGH